MGGGRLAGWLDGWQFTSVGYATYFYRYYNVGCRSSSRCCRLHVGGGGRAELEEEEKKNFGSGRQLGV